MLTHLRIVKVAGVRDELFRSLGNPTFPLVHALKRT